MTILSNYWQLTYEKQQRIKKQVIMPEEEKRIVTRWRDRQREEALKRLWRKREEELKCLWEWRKQ